METINTSSSKVSINTPPLEKALIQKKGEFVLSNAALKNPKILHNSYMNLSMNQIT